MKSRIKKNSWLQDITPSEYTVGIIKCTVRFLLILYLFYESILPAILLFPLWFLLTLTRQFLSVMEKMKDYMLEPNYLMLSEKYIFEKNENYFFCFFPENEKTWQVSYHELTEYFVRKVDYQDLESIQLACMLHKETIKETYDLESILQQYEEEAKNREEKSKEEKIREESKREKDRREMEENQNIEIQENSYYNKARENYAVMEEKRYGPIKKFAKRFKSGKWGEWEDLITEADDYE